MPRLAINATLDNLRRQMSRGEQHGAAKGSAGNVMPGPAATTATPSLASTAGTTAGLGANPSRVGAVPASTGNYQQIKGSPAPAGPPTPDTVRTHSLALGGLKHLVDAGHLHPTHARAMESKSRAHIAAYKKSNTGAKKAAAPASRFGALGAQGGTSPNTGGAGVGGGSQVPSAPVQPAPPERDW
jgi:hypothetical protein